LSVVSPVTAVPTAEPAGQVEAAVLPAANCAVVQRSTWFT
jgi:hypothetical protein